MQVALIEQGVAPGGGAWLGGQLFSAMVVRTLWRKMHQTIYAGAVSCPFMDSMTLPACTSYPTSCLPNAMLILHDEVSFPWLLGWPITCLAGLRTYTQRAALVSQVCARLAASNIWHLSPCTCSVHRKRSAAGMRPAHLYVVYDCRCANQPISCWMSWRCPMRMRAIMLSSSTLPASPPPSFHRSSR